MDNKRYSHGGLTFKIDKADNETFIATITRHDRKRKEDSEGALTYVVVVILIYGLSILMMIASYIRKNKVDQRLNRYFKDMATVRKREEQLQLYNAANIAAALQATHSERPSTDLTPSPRSSHEDDRQAPFSRDKGIEMKLLPGKPVPQTHLVPPENAPRRAQTPARRSQRNCVRFTNEQSDLDSDNDNVFVSPAPDRKTHSPSSFNYLSPIASPLLSPHETTLIKLLDKPDDSDNDTTSRSRQSSVTDTDQQSIEIEQSPLILRTPDRQRTERDHPPKDYLLVSSV